MYKVQRKREGSFAVELHGVSLIVKEITIKGNYISSELEHFGEHNGVKFPYLKVRVTFELRDDIYTVAKRTTRLIQW